MKYIKEPQFLMLKAHEAETTCNMCTRETPLVQTILQSAIMDES